TLAGNEFEIVDGDANRNSFERERIANFGRCGRTTHYFLTNRDADGSQHVSLLTILIFQQGKTSRTTRIILDRGNGGFDTMLLAKEINDAEFLLVATADAARRDATIHVASA